MATRQFELGGRLYGALPAVLCGVMALTTSALAAESRVMTVDALKKKGIKLEKTVDADLNGDGRKELVAIGTNEKGVVVAIVGENAAGAVVTFVAPPALGQTIAKVEAKALVPPSGSQQVILEIYDETPDEKVKRVRVYGGKGEGANLKLEEIFTSKVERAKKGEERAEWERDKSIVQYGDPRPGWYFEDREDDKVFDVYVRRKPQILTVNKGGETVKLLTGVREVRWTFDPGVGKFTEGPEGLNDFIPAHTITSVEASDSWVEPRELKQLKAQALSDALMQAQEKESDAASDAAAQAVKGDKSKSASAKKTDTEEVKLDLSMYAKMAADQDLNTAWIENAKNDGKGEWVELTLEEESEIHMVRIVSGCVANKKEFQKHNVPESFSIRFDNGSDVEINRRAPDSLSTPAIAMSDTLAKTADRPFARTTLVFFDGKVEAKKVRVTLGKAAKQGSANQTCISEISVH